MPERSGTDLSLPGRLWIGLCLMLGIALMVGACTSRTDSTSEETQSPSEEANLSQPSIGNSDATGNTPECVLIYIDASEASNRLILQQRINQIKEKQEASAAPWMIFFSQHNEPVVASDSLSYPLLRRALTQQFPPIPKPKEEADRLWQHLQSLSPQWKEQELRLHCFFSPSFHDISVNVFFDQLLENLQSHFPHIELAIYMDGPVPEQKRLRHPALKSVSYIQLTNDHLL